MNIAEKLQAVVKNEQTLYEQKQAIVTALNEAGIEASMEDTIEHLGKLGIETYIKMLQKNMAGKVVFPNNLDAVSAYAYYTQDITEIELHNNVTAIYGGAFSYCESLDNVTIPDSVTLIANEAFYACFALKKIRIGKGVTSIGSNAFQSCSKMAEVHIESLSSWLRCSFSNSYAVPFPTGCTADLYINGELVTDLVVPEGIKSMGNYALIYLKSLESAYIPSSTAVGGSFLMGCPKLKKCTYLYEKLVSNSLLRCTALTDLTLGTVTSYYSMFTTLTSLTNVKADSIKIYNNNFNMSKCSQLTVESMVNLMTAFVDNTGGTAYTVYFGNTNLAKLTQEQKNIALNKNIKLG